jgi:hypothetical protein
MRRYTAFLLCITAVVIFLSARSAAMAATATTAAPVAVGAELEKALEGLDSGLVRSG